MHYVHMTTLCSLAECLRSHHISTVHLHVQMYIYIYIYGLAPQYLSKLVNLYQDGQLDVPWFRLTTYGYGWHSFICACTAVWNGLSDSLKGTVTILFLESP